MVKSGGKTSSFEIIREHALSMQLLKKNEKVFALICINFNGTLPKNSPSWIHNLNQNKLIWQPITISMNEILELYNLGIDVMLTRNDAGQIKIAINEIGWRFGQR